MYNDNIANTRDAISLEDMLDEIVTPDRPKVEVHGDDIVILSKFDCGRQVILQNFDIDNGEKVSMYELEKLVWDCYEHILSDIVSGGIEYCETNGIEIVDSD